MRHLGVLAVLLWALLPAGLMPVQNGLGGLTFALCSGDGPVMVAVAADGKRMPVPHMPGHDKQPCPYAAAAVSATDGTFAALPAPLSVVLSRAEPWPLILVPVAPIAFVRPIPRGPPALPKAV